MSKYIVSMVFSIVALGLVAASCQALGSEVNSYLRDLSAKSEATRGECLVAVAIVLGRRENLDDTAGIVDLLERHDVLFEEDLQEMFPKGIEAEEGNLDSTVDRGYACLLFKRALGEKGGLLGRIFKSSERYAYRHLEYLGMIPSGGPWVEISGPELIGLLSTAHRRKKADWKSD